VCSLDRLTAGFSALTCCAKGPATCRRAMVVLHQRPPIRTVHGSARSLDPRHAGAAEKAPTPGWGAAPCRSNSTASGRAPGTRRRRRPRPGAAPSTTMRARKPAITSISRSPIPRRVTSVVPRRSPPGRSQSPGRSPGIRFLFVMMFAAPSRWATDGPPPNGRTSAMTWCVRVKPLCAPSIGMPWRARAAPSACALRTIRAMYTDPNAIISAADTASAATRLTWCVAASVGKITSARGAVNSGARPA
jgi:hypothetical protein